MKYKQLFAEEERVLQSAQSEIARLINEGVGGCEGYQVLAEQYRKLMYLTRKIFYISDRQGEMLRIHQEQMRNIFNNANQGFLTFGIDLKVDHMCSEKCSAIFGKEISDHDIVGLLTESESYKKQLSSAFCSVFQGDTVCENKIHELPNSFQIADKEIRVEYKAIQQLENKKAVSVIMMILTDITESVKAKKEIDFLGFLSRHDLLTNLHNRTYLEDVLPELEQPENFPVSTVMLDINGLKLTNDIFGHQQGDVLLQEMAKILKSNCRSKDIIIRWGGDEFVLLLPRTNEIQCREVCRRIREAASRSSNCVITVSAAMGMATQESVPFSFTQQLLVADNAMYEDKRSTSQAVRLKLLKDLESQLVKTGMVSEGHSERLSEMIKNFLHYIGHELSLTDADLLQKLILLHDVGKIAVVETDGECLNFIREETEDDDDAMVQIEATYRIVESIGERSVADLLLTLQERWDGRGYPKGLKGEAIPFLSRVFSLLEQYDTMIHCCCDNVRVSPQEAVRLLHSEEGKKFDPVLVERFIAWLNKLSVYK